MAPSKASDSSRAPVLVERFVKQLNIVFKAVKLYPGSSDIPRDNAVLASASLRAALEHQPAMRLTVSREGLVYEGCAVFPETPGFTQFAREFYSRQLSEVRFHASCTEDDILAFLSLLAVDPESIAASGGFESAMWERGIVGVSVADISTRIVDVRDPGEAADEVEAEGSVQAEDDLTDELVEGALAGRPRDQRLLVRFMSDPAALRSYLRESSTTRGSAPDEVAIARRTEMLAHCLRDELPEEREALLRSLAEALLGLDPDMRKKLLSSRLLVEARRDDMVAAVVRQMGVDEVMQTLLHEVDESPASSMGVARAVRNLTLINLPGVRETVLPEAAEAMAAAGLSDGFVSEVIDAAAPRRLEMNERVRTSEAQPVESILRLIDLTPEHSGAHANDPGMAALREEAARGLTDGDVLSALVCIVTLEERAEELGSVMVMLEDNVGLLVDQQEFDVAADAAEALTLAEQDPNLESGHRRRMRTLLRVLAKPESMRAIASALRVYRHESAEHAACRRLLSVLGAQALAPLLEVLADEPDMAARKSIVDIISGMGPGFIGELGERVSDPRWYFVRNIVAILAASRDPRVLPFLERTLRHPDERVRRETVRALAGIRDSLAEQMLVAGLDDPDPVNVQVAARYLGAIGCRGAAAALEQVARGEGRGNRENGPRIEAIEALARLGDPSSAAVLQDIARQRSLLGSRNRQVCAAAEAAVGTMTTEGDEPGGGS